MARGYGVEREKGGEKASRDLINQLFLPFALKLHLLIERGAEVKGQLACVSLFLSPGGSWGSNPGRQDWEAGSFITESSHWPSFLL